MDVVTAATPMIDGIPMVAEPTIKAVYTTGKVIVIDAKDLKTFAFRAGIVAVYAGFTVWSAYAIKDDVKEWKHNRARKKAVAARKAQEQKAGEK